MDMQQSNLDITRIRFFTAFASLLLSLQAVYFDDIINRDGIMYLQMSEAYLSGGLAATKLIFDWPFFSILVAWFHQITSIDLELSALIINSLFFILLTDTLVRISSLILENRQQLFIAALLVLCFSTINEYRDFIMRDFGYWAFCSLALYHFMLFSETTKLRHANLWQAYILIAVLFRIEGSIILLTLPFFNFFRHGLGSGFYHFLKSTSLVILSGFAGILLFLSQSDIPTAFGKLASISAYLNIDGYISKITDSSSFLAENILNKFSEDYAALILVAGLLSMMLFKLAKTFSLSYIIVYAISVQAKAISASEKQSNYQKLLLYFFIVNLIILTVFLFHQYFLSSRYLGMALISLLLLLMSQMCHGITHLWQQERYFPLGIIVFSLFYSVADTAIMSTTKTYIKDTALWAAHNLPANSKVMTDDEFIMYYFERDNESSSLCVRPISHEKTFMSEHSTQFIHKPCKAPKTEKLNYFDYVVLVEKKRYHEYIAYLETLELELLYRANSKKGDRASVYRVIN